MFIKESHDDYRRPNRAFTSPSTSILLPSSLHETLEDLPRTVDCQKTENDWNELLSQVRICLLLF